MSNLQNLRDQDVEKNATGPGSSAYSNGNTPSHLDHKEDSETALRKIRTAGSISISPELFEKIYLSPKNRVSGDMRSTFANPTPLAILGFVMSLTPLSCILMGWRGSGGFGAAEVGVFYFFGGTLMLLGGVLEFVLGNTFPFIVFASFGAFWLAYGATVTPYFNASGAYAAATTTSTPTAANPTFQATYAFFFVFMGLLCLIYLVCALRTNAVFVGIFFTLVLAFCCLAGSFWQNANGNTATTGPRLQKAGGAFTFVTSLLGWYLLTVQMLASVDFPFVLPVGDVSHFVRGASERNPRPKAE